MWLQLHLLDHSLAAQVFNIIGKARGLELRYSARMNNCPVFSRTEGVFPGYGVWVLELRRCGENDSVFFHRMMSFGVN